MKIEVERLRMLYAMLDGIPADRVDCTQNYRPYLLPGLNLKANNASTRSVLGWASVYPLFAAQGLRATHDGTPTYRGRHGLKAGALFFGLNAKQAEWMFVPHSHVAKHKAVVLSKIRFFLLSEGAITEERKFQLIIATTRFPRERK